MGKHCKPPWEYTVSEFARREGVSAQAVAKAIKSGKLTRLPDGTVDPDLVGSGWRRHRRGNTVADQAVPEKIEQLAEALSARAPYSLNEATRVKENYLALLRQLEYDAESGAVVPVAEVAAAVTAEYAAVRNQLLGLPAKLAPRLAFMKSADGSPWPVVGVSHGGTVRPVRIAGQIARSLIPLEKYLANCRLSMPP